MSNYFFSGNFRKLFFSHEKTFLVTSDRKSFRKNENWSPTNICFEFIFHLFFDFFAGALSFRETATTSSRPTFCSGNGFDLIRVDFYLFRKETNMFKHEKERQQLFKPKLIFIGVLLNRQTCEKAGFVG